jgi:hypothetical protein
VGLRLGTVRGTPGECRSGAGVPDVPPYAERFNLAWPRLLGERFEPSPLALGLMSEGSPSPSPEPCKITGIDPEEATICVGQSITFTAEGENLDDVEWSGGGDPATGSGSSFTTKWDTPGSKLVFATCGESSASASVTVVEITFGSDPIRTGFTKPVASSTIASSEFLTCDPPEEVSNVTLHVTGIDRVDIQIIEVIPETGYLLFNVKGTSATPSNKPNGDTTIEARVNGHTCAKAQAIVVVPDRFRQPYPQADGNVDPENLVTDHSTSPAYFGALQANQVKLAICWIQWLTIGVNDQFNEPLDELYEGVDVEEKAGGTWHDINQDLTDSGTYEDPVFYFQQPADPVVNRDSERAVDWPTDPTLAMGVGGSAIQIIPVRVGGHPIGSVNRKWTATPPKHFKVEWPPP